MSPPTLTVRDALILVDLQKDFFPGSRLAVPDGDAILPVVHRWIQAAADSEATLIATRDWHSPEHCSFEQQGGDWPIHCVEQTEGAKFHEQIELPGKTIVQSKGNAPHFDQYSGFDRTNLADSLRRRGVERLWIMGLALDVCVKWTAVDAAEAGFQTHVVLPGTRAVNVNPGDGDRAVEAMKQAGAIIETEA